MYMNCCLKRGDDWVKIVLFGLKQATALTNALTNAMANACGATNPRVPTKEEVVELYRQAHQAGA